MLGCTVNKKEKLPTIPNALKDERRKSMMDNKKGFNSVSSQPGWPKKQKNYRVISFKHILKTGHCAPAVMRTLLKIRGAEDEHMVIPVSGMGGGIGLTEAECGSATSSIMTLGLMYGKERDDNNIPKVIGIGQRYLDRFKDVNKSVLCKQITPNKRDFRPCIKAMCSAPSLLLELVQGKAEAIISDANEEGVEANIKLLNYFSDCDFHCAQTVLKNLGKVIAVDEELLLSSYGFIGGTVLKGLTCSALTAGVHAIGMKFGAFEDSYMRVAKLMYLFLFNQDAAMSDHINKSNRAMNISYELALRFEEKFESTICRDIIQANFSTKAGANKYISENKMDKCVQITNFVADEVQKMMDENLIYDVPKKMWGRG
jgi:C_GCAxxG_C_C family probable redox protein